MSRKNLIGPGSRFFDLDKFTDISDKNLFNRPWFGWNDFLNLTAIESFLNEYQTFPWKKTKEGKIYQEIDLPGYTKEEISVKITEGDYLNIFAENENRGTKEYNYSLPKNTKNIKVNFTDGVLAINVDIHREEKPEVTIDF